MPWLKKVDEASATGYVKEVFDELKERGGSIPDAYQMMALRPEVLQGREILRKAVSTGTSTLGRRREEMLSYFVATLGQCTR